MITATTPDRPLLSPADLRREFADDLIRTTGNFRSTTWLGHTIRQNTLDLWVIQETIAEVRPALLIECGTNLGGSALFYAHLCDLLGNGRIVSIDVEKRHSIEHPRITFLLGSSTAPAIRESVAAIVRQTPGPILLILDSDHSEAHVRRELELYAPFVTTGSYVLVQDGVIDVLPTFETGRPGPLPAIEAFLHAHPRAFAIDHARCRRFPITHHPKGWLKRQPEPMKLLAERLMDDGLRRVAVFGTGSGASRAADALERRGVHVVAFIERDGRPGPSDVLGRPVHRLSRIGELGGIDALVVGSLTYVNDMSAALRDAIAVAGLNVPVFAPEPSNS